MGVVLLRRTIEIISALMTKDRVPSKLQASPNPKHLYFLPALARELCSVERATRPKTQGRKRKIANALCLTPTKHRGWKAEHTLAEDRASLMRWTSVVARLKRAGGSRRSNEGIAAMWYMEQAKRLLPKPKGAHSLSALQLREEETLARSFAKD
jgi:hypothetical protein